MRKVLLVLASFAVLVSLLFLSKLLWKNLESKDLQLIMLVVSALVIGYGVGSIAGIFWDS